MSTSRHFDRICIAAAAVILLLTILFMNGASLGISAAEKEIGYEKRLFDTSYVHTIDIVMDDWDTFIENCEDEEYASCTALIDGEKYANIAIRAKGNTSLSNVRNLGSQRYSFKIEFDHYEKGKTFHGLDKLCLNNLIQDNTMMKDYLVYQMMDEFGAEAPLSSYACITVNGNDWGLYLAVEGIEDSFLERIFGSDTGELYKPDSMSFGGGRGNGKGFRMDEFDFGGTDSVSGATNKEQAPADPNAPAEDTDSVSGATEENAGRQRRMPQGIGDGSDSGNMPPQMPSGDGSDSGNMPPQMPGSMPGGDGSDNMPPQMPGGDKGGMGRDMGSDDVKLKYIDDDPASYSNIFENAKTDVSDSDRERLILALKNLSEYKNIEDTVNIDEVIRYFVVHNFVCNGDSYTGNMIHNYYLHENGGKLSMIPWDYNLAFGTFQGNQASSTVNTSIDSPVSGGNVDDRPMLGWIFSDEEYTALYHDIFSEFIGMYFTDDELVTRIRETADLIRPYVEKDPTRFCTVEEFEKGIEAITSFVTLRGEAVSRQLEGDSTAVDTGTLNLSDMGTMDAGMGGMGRMEGKMERPGQSRDAAGGAPWDDAAGGALGDDAAGGTPGNAPGDAGMNSAGQQAPGAAVQSP